MNNHYYFQCREIEGHKIFAVPVEKAYQIHRDSQKGLSGIEKSRFALSTEFGKLEVAGMIDAPDFKKLGVDLPPEAMGFVKALIGEGLIFFKAHRVPDTSFQGGLIIARRNPKALWITGYNDRILYDGRRPEGDRWTPLGNTLKTLLAPVVDVGNLDVAKVAEKALRQTMN